MFDKIRENIIKKLAEKIYPGRNINVVKIANHFFVTCKDKLGARNDYKLKGTYSYDQVMELNNLTGYYASFGFCKEIGPVAFIGIPNPNCTKNSGYFHCDIHEYGKPLSNEEYYFECYNDEIAKRIGNYTVYGMRDPRELNNAAPIDKVSYIYDYRYEIKDYIEENCVHGVLRMDAKLKGTYNFYEARMIAYGSLKKPEGYSGNQVPLQFAIVNGEPIGILNLWSHQEGKQFRDVWGVNEQEPAELPIHFISDEEAKKMNNFKLYFFKLNFSFRPDNYKIEKVDRTLEKDFNFIMEDGTDYRLQTIETKNKVLRKTK